MYGPMPLTIQERNRHVMNSLFDINHFDQAWSEEMSRTRGILSRRLDYDAAGNASLRELERRTLRDRLGLHLARFRWRSPVVRTSTPIFSNAIERKPEF